jgi:hypothetical protein
MEAIFSAIPKNGKLVFQFKEDFDKYLELYDDQILTIRMEPQAVKGEKRRMNAYLHGPVLDCAVNGYWRHGYAGIDKVQAMYKLQAEFAKGYIENTTTGVMEPYPIPLSSMDKERLYKFLVDVLFFIETDLEQEVPDSTSWKMKKMTGRNFKSTKHTMNGQDT